MDSVNSRLTELYTNSWPNLAGQLEEIKASDQIVKPTNPLLLSVKEEDKYLNADLRVMIFGQETNDWGGDFTNNIEYIKSIYDDFFSSRHCFKYGGQFWNGINRFLKMLELQYPDKSIEFMWNNVVKIGKSGKRGKPPENIYQIERQNFQVIEEEIKILKPNLIVFLSGPYYDYIINEQLNITEYQKINGYDQRQIARINIKNIDFTFRTYHPNYLWRNGINNYYEAILKSM